MINETSEGLPDIEAKAYLVLDGSDTMSEIERITGELKHRRTARLSQSWQCCQSPPGWWRP
jgi:hypothetical protein